MGDGFSIAWRVLDAKDWGVPQRRKRIFLVCDFRGQRAGEILFKREGLLRDFKAGGEARQEDSGVAVGSADRDYRAFHLQQDPISGQVSPCIGAQRQATVGVVYAADCRNLRLTEEVSGTLQAKANGGYSLNYQNPVVYREPKRGEITADNIGSTLIAHLEHNPNDIVVYDERGNGDGKTVSTLTGDHESRVTDYTALIVSNGQLNQMSMSDKAGALNCMHDQQAVLIKKTTRYIVRRLTPLECCRLQGFPDWWEDGVDGSDSARYKMWGNGMALPCVMYVMEGFIAEE